MNEIVIDEELTLVPYYPNYDETYTWYQDKDVCKQVDNIDHVYSMETLVAMYTYLSAHGYCFYGEGGQRQADGDLRSRACIHCAASACENGWL